MYRWSDWIKEIIASVPKRRPIIAWMRPICAKKKRDLLKHCEGLPEDRRAYYQDMKADGEVVDSGDDTDGEGGHADESGDSESDNDNNSGNDDD
jgi:hypothetical protein